MTARSSFVTVTDQFCGAGGSSLGAVNAGAELRLALNHWQLAIETHNSNFPNADHDCTDVSACDPRRYPSTDILITSPECTSHSLAKGKTRKWQRQLEMFGRLELDPAEERSRATMWDVCRFAEHHRYRYIIVENVVDARLWAPFEAWLQAMHLLGYDHQCVYFNSMHAHPTPQSRDRMYVVFWRKGHRAPDLRYFPPAWCPKCERNVESVQSWKNPQKRWGKYRQQYVFCCPTCATVVEPYYYAAANAIDWSLPAPRIGDRARPLKEKTLRRIQIGLEKYGRRPLLIDYVHTARNERHQDMVWTVDDRPHRTMLGIHTQALLTPPFTIETQWSHAEGDRSAAVSEALPTQTAQQGRGLVVPPLLIDFVHSDHDVSTVTTIDRHALVTSPFIVSYYTRLAGQQAAVSGLDESLPTVPGRAVHYLAQPGETPAVDDCGFRMLQPHEIQAAMAFPADYKVLGAQRDRVKQLGNAVTPPVLEWLMRRVLEAMS